MWGPPSGGPTASAIVIEGPAKAGPHVRSGPAHLRMATVVIAGYLLGSIPFALLMARRWGLADLRQIGSGNLGAANVMRASGVKAGVLVALLDMLKGAASVVLAERLSPNAAAPAVAGLAA